MKKLTFRRMTLRDFKEYRGRHKIDLGNLGLGLHYIRGVNKVDALGSNGAGKTTLFDAFSWVLTGKTTRGLRGTDVRTWGSKDNAIVQISFRVDDVLHVLKRSTEKNGLWLDDKLTSQDEIERLIGLTSVNIPHTILLGQKRDLFFDLLPQAKLTILSETLNLDKWDERSKRAKDKAADLMSEIMTLNAKLDSQKAQLDTLVDTLQDQKRQSSQWEDERAQGSDKREREIAKLKKGYAQAESERGAFDLAYDGAETELRALRRDIAKEAEEYQNAAERLSSVKATITAKLDRLHELKSIKDTCPTCGQTIKDAVKAAKHAKAERIAVRTELDRLDKIKNKRTSITNEIKFALEIMRTSEKEFGEKSDNAKDKYDQLTSRMADIDKQIAVLKAQDRSSDVNPYEDQVRSTRSAIKKLRSQVVETEDDIARMTRRHAHARYWVQGFKDIRLHLLQEVLAELQEVTQNILPEFGLSGWAVEYDIERETKTGKTSSGLSVQILKPGMHSSVRWEAWSGGENQRLLVVGALALSEVLLRHAGIDCEMIVLDEPTRHMSKEGVNDIVDHLITLGRGKQVFYVDHQAIESNRFASVITIEKDNQGSRITSQ